MRLFRQVTMNDERLKKFPFKRELAMQAYVLENPEILKLDGDYDDIEIYDEEIPIKDGGSKNNNGRIDMVAFYSGEHIAIIEFKKDTLVGDNLTQLKNYLTQRENLKETAPRIFSKFKTQKPKWIGILVGTSIDAELEKDISDGAECDGIPIAAITIERFRSPETRSVYVTTDVYFKSKSSGRGRDQAKYRFNDEVYKKGPLALAVVQEHVARHPQITFEDLKKALPQNLVPNKLFRPFAEANADYSDKHPRHYVKDNQAIRLINGTFAVSNQWQVDTIESFIKRAEELGYEISKLNYTPQTKKIRLAKDKNEPDKDRTKYQFNGDSYPKNQLTLAVIQEHVKKNAGITHKILLKDFPQNIPSNGLFKPFAEAKELYKTKIPRHYIKDTQAIRLADGVFAVSNQWTIKTVTEFIEIARGLGYTITEAKK